MEHPRNFPMNDSDVYNQFIKIDRLFEYFRGIMDAQSERIDAATLANRVRTDSLHAADEVLRKRLDEHTRYLDNVHKNYESENEQRRKLANRIYALEQAAVPPAVEPAAPKPGSFDEYEQQRAVRLGLVPPAPVSMDPPGDVPPAGYRLWKCADGAFDLVNDRAECVAEGITADQLVRAFLRHGG